MKRKLFLICISLSLVVGIVNAQYTILHNFNDTNGANPYGSLAISGGKLYGTTVLGGTYNYGCIFSVDTNGNNYKVLHSFDNINGKWPETGLIIIGNVLYGTAYRGGPGDYGCIFSIHMDGSMFKDLLDFNSTNGAYPLGSLLFLNNKLYGMVAGGANNDGCIFSIDTNGSNYSDLFDFNNTNGKNPKGNLIVSGKTFFGTTYYGGSTGDGVIFSIDTTGKNYKILLNFYGTNGKNPGGGLVLSYNMLYGMAHGGVSGGGCIYSIDTNGGNYTDLYNLNAGSYIDGNALTLNGNKLYGSVSASTGLCNYGHIFSLDTNGNKFTEMHIFHDTDGANPYGAPLISGQFLYGTTYWDSAKLNYGLVFKLDTSSTVLDSTTLSSTHLLTKQRIEVHVFPNPTNGKFTIEVQGGRNKQQMEIYNMLGEKVYTSEMLTKKEIDLSDRPNGVYLYRIVTKAGNLVAQGKIVIQ